MDGVGAGLAGGGEKSVDGEIRLGEGCGAQPDCHRGLADVGCRRIGIGVDRHGLVPEPVGGADDPPGDLTPIGDEDPHRHIRYTSPGPGAGSSWMAARARQSPSTSRVSAGSMMPSSQSRDVA